MNAILKDKSFQLSILLTSIFVGTGIAFLFLGLVDYSWILFGLLPVVLGVAIGTMKVRKYALWGAVITTTILLIGIYIPGLSGVICIVMAIGLVVPFIFLGYVIARLVKRYRLIKETNSFSVLLLPLIPFLIAAPTEHFLKKEKETIIEVRTEKVFNYTPDQVYDAIKSVDTLDAEKPFLLKLDLPIPTKCILEKEEVGALRTCYFKGGRLSNADFGGGTITERVTQIERGRVLKMDVIDYNLIGRKWLGFKEAIYYFQPAGNNGCKLTRITTYSSILTPNDLTKFGSILFMALIGLIIASIVNLFLSSSMLYWITTYVGVFVFTGLIAYKTQEIKNFAGQVQEGTDEYNKSAVMSAFSLYLSFVNLFLMLLRIFGRRR